MRTGRPVSNPSTSCVSIWNKYKTKHMNTCSSMLHCPSAVHQQQVLCFSDLVVVSAEIFKMSEADVREADDDCDDQNHKREHGGRS